MNSSMQMPASSVYHVFHGENFAGNPAALHIVASLENGQALQSIAHGSGIMDNVFIEEPASDTTEPVPVRFFSKHGEFLLCGHGLLALAHWLSAGYSINRYTLSVNNGYRVEIGCDGSGPWIALPRFDPMPLTDAGGLYDCLEKQGIRVERLLEAPNSVFVAVLSDYQALRAVNADDIEGLTFPEKETSPGAMIFTAQDEPQAYALRYFTPWHGKIEDSGTGSAQCYLAPLWLENGEQARVLQPGPSGEACMQVMLETDRVILRGKVIHTRPM